MSRILGRKVKRFPEDPISYEPIKNIVAFEVRHGNRRNHSMIFSKETLQKLFNSQGSNFNQLLNFIHQPIGINHPFTKQPILAGNIMEVHIPSRKRNALSKFKTIAQKARTQKRESNTVTRLQTERKRNTATGRRTLTRQTHT
jgi:hypothetical protein